MTPPGPPQAAEPELIRAVPLRRPGRAISAVIILVLLGLFVYGAATNDAYQWSLYRTYLFDQRISQAAIVTLQLTVIAMAIGIVLGIVLAVMRLSPNLVLKSVAWSFLWLFRGTPVYVQLTFWGLVTTIYNQIDLGIPFVVQIDHHRRAAGGEHVVDLGAELLVDAGLAELAEHRAERAADQAQARDEEQHAHQQAPHGAGHCRGAHQLARGVDVRLALCVDGHDGKARELDDVVALQRDHLLVGAGRVRGVVVADDDQFGHVRSFPGAESGVPVDRRRRTWA